MVQTNLGHSDVQKQFISVFRQLTYRHQSWQVWSDFVTMAAIAIVNAVHPDHFDQREKTYLEIINRYEAAEQQAFPKLFALVVTAFEENPEQDFLGNLFMSLNLGSHWKGQFFTPYHVCNLMAEIQCADLKGVIQEKGYVSVNDPACGAGALLIAAANTAKNQSIHYQECMLFVAQDIDLTAAMMCYIQLSLLGCGGCVIVGDTLSQPPVNPMANTPNIWYTPMYFSGVWHHRRAWDQFRDLMQDHPSAQQTEQEETEVNIPVAEALPVHDDGVCIQLTLF